MNRYYLYCKKADFKKISETFHISPMLSRIIRNRDIVSEEEIEEYLNGGTDRLSDPFLMKGMEETVPLLLHTINCGDPIRIIG
ncbi:MAG: single-stranded-DNA-specific exonuclease RecJ, partial [Parasporobacterium sp.]|nr:single-stranded-DNA-specific exonuclease RecJ [Parasporobacterium sp.]